MLLLTPNPMFSATCCGLREQGLDWHGRAALAGQVPPPASGPAARLACAIPGLALEVLGFRALGLDFRE